MGNIRGKAIVFLCVNETIWHMNNPFQDLADKLNNIEGILQELKQSPIYTPTNAETELLDVSQTAQFLRLTTQTVYDKIHNGTLPYVKQGNRIYFFKDELILWLKSGRLKTDDLLQEEVREITSTALSTRQRRRARKAV